MLRKDHPVKNLLTLQNLKASASTRDPNSDLRVVGHSSSFTTEVPNKRLGTTVGYIVLSSFAGLKNNQLIHRLSSFRVIEVVDDGG